MRSKALNPTEYIASLPEERRAAVGKLRRVLKRNLPKGFAEEMGYGMLAYVVPHELYPPGYHCDRDKPLPFINVASQKNYVSLYHMGLYDGPLLDWFKKRWQADVGTKLDLGKCCARFRKPELIPFDLIGELATKMTPKEWIAIYEQSLASPQRGGGEVSFK